MNSYKSILVPAKLPLLEALCWNISNPYSLTPQQMLEIYESRARFNNVLGKANTEELKFIAQLSQTFNLPSTIVKPKIEKQQFYQLVKQITDRIDKQFLIKHQAYFGGGTMMSLEADKYRLSYDLDFICNLNSFNQLKRWFYNHQSQDLFSDRSVEVGEIRQDAYTYKVY